MANGNTNFGNAAGSGTVGADGFNGPLTATNATISGVTAILGSMKWSGTSVAAAGTVIGNATIVPATKIYVRVSAAASTAGAKLTTIVTNRVGIVKANATVGFKFYATGAKIDAVATGTAVAVASNKAILFWCASPTQVYTFKSA